MTMRKRRKILIAKIKHGKQWEWHTNKIMRVIAGASQKMSQALYDVYHQKNVEQE